MDVGGKDCVVTTKKSKLPFQKSLLRSPMAAPHCISLEDIREAHQRIRPWIRRTPCLSFETLNVSSGSQIVFKCENLQEVGAFKARGATNAVLSLTEDEAARGVATHSSGNHAAALARAARIRGIPAHIVMPANSRPNKLRAVRNLGVEPILCGPSAQERQAAAQAVVEQTGATLIHPYDLPAIMAGQGTAALEMTEELEPLDVVLIPVGGGGLLSGSLIALKALWPKTQVIAAEPAWADDAWRSWKSGRIEQPNRYDTIADGLRTPLGTHTFPVIRDLIDDIILVKEGEIIQATKLLTETTRTLVEPSGALPFAALLTDPQRFEEKRTGIILSGGNLDLENLPWKP